MYYKKCLFAVITLLLICNNVYGKKTKKNKRPKEPEEPTTIQPSVVAYSTFGFNDVGSYDGFVPTSPEYSSFLSGVNQETSTRLYAPAFPSASDATGFGGNYGTQLLDGQTFGMIEDGIVQPGMSKFTYNSMNFMNNQNFPSGREQNDAQDVNSQNADESDAPIYGTKISTRNKNRPSYPDNNAEMGSQNNGYSNPSDGRQPETPAQEKPALNELNSSYQYNINYAPSFAPQDSDDFAKLDSQFNANVQNALNFPRVVDFTNLSNKYYPTDLDTSKLTSESINHSNQQMAMAHSQIDNSFANSYNVNKFVDNMPTSFGEPYNPKHNEESNDKNVLKSNVFFEPDYTNKHVAAHYKHNDYQETRYNTTKKPDQKKKIKQKPWASGNYSNNFKDWKDASAPSSSSSLKGYGYSTNYSSMNFKYDVSEPKKPHNHDEIVPASSNIVDLTAYQYPEKDYSNFKKMPEYNNEDEYPGESIYKDRFKSSDYSNPYKNYFSTVPTTTSSYWGGFKSTDFTSYSDHPKKHQYSVTENNHDEVVNIPKRPYKYNKGSQNKQIEWPPTHTRPQKINRPFRDWTKDFVDTRYKSEEDLLGLRTHDTSHPSYLPTYKPNNNVLDNDNDFKQLVEKWKQSYINTKYNDVPYRDYEGYGSEVKSYHVPVPKPYPIEVPHPVIVPVPRPFPVRVPISRPVAVPVLRELTVPIVKPVPYPVYKNVPYPVEKPVPVPVEKEVAVPVEKPYPVHIPYVRPVFHHTKPVHEDQDEEEYPRRPEYKKPTQYKKRPERPERPAYGTRTRRQRPSRASYQERNRRRWPDRRHPSGYNSEHRQSFRPNGFQKSPPYRHREYEHEMDEDEHRDYYCRRTGNC